MERRDYEDTEETIRVAPKDLRRLERDYKGALYFDHLEMNGDGTDTYKIYRRKAA